jgi:uncharacterized ubiquitin-like protein YukD
VQPGSPQQGEVQQTVQVRVQVIDLESFTLDLQVPTYLPARDLTQRVARDAGLEAYWSDGRRRLYWLRARGRLLRDEEKLQDLGVVNGELVYLLPEPPAGSGVVEQTPDFPETRGYAGKGIFALLSSVFGLVVFAVAWGWALTMQRDMWTVLAPGLALGLMCVSLSRHLFGGLSTQIRVLVAGLVLFVTVFMLAFLPGVIMGEAPSLVYYQSLPGFVLGFGSVFLGWLAWWGAVEPLAALNEVESVAQQQQEEAAAQCGICGLGVASDVRENCAHACGQVFHKGCHAARVSVYRGDSRFCAVCNARVA